MHHATKATQIIPVSIATAGGSSLIWGPLHWYWKKIVQLHTLDQAEHSEIWEKKYKQKIHTHECEW